MATDDEFLQVTLPALDLVHNLARRFGRGRADAEDLVQDTYLRAWQAWTAGNRPRRAEAWLATICLNLGRDRLRRASLRSEVAPQPLRERVRVAVAAASRSDRRRRRRPLVAVAVAVAATFLAVLAGSLLVRQDDAGQPAVIAAAVASYRTGGLDGSTASPAQPRVRQAGALEWRGARQGRLAGLPVVAHDYRDAAGRHLTLLLADRSFPEAVGASHPPGAAIWVAEVDGVAVLCADRPSPSLLVGRDRAEVLLAASQLGLH